MPLFFLSLFYVYIIFQGGAYMSNEELRAMYKERLKREKQYYIAEATGIDKAILSRFKNNKIDLYPHLFKKLESYLLNN